MMAQTTTQSTARTEIFKNNKPISTHTWYAHFNFFEYFKSFSLKDIDFFSHKHYNRHILYICRYVVC